MYVADYIRACDSELVTAASEAVLLHHCPHGSIEYEHTLPHRLSQRLTPCSLYRLSMGITICSRHATGIRCRRYLAHAARDWLGKCLRPIAPCILWLLWLLSCCRFLSYADTLVNLPLCLCCLVFLDDAHGLLNLLLVMEVHLKMYALSPDIVEQRTQLLKCDPAAHDTLPRIKYLPVERVPFLVSSLWLSYSWCPLYCLQLVYLEYGGEMMEGADTVKVVQRVGYSLALLAEIRLDEAAVIGCGYHGRDV